MAELNELTINGSNYTFEDDVARGLANTEASRAQSVEQSLQDNKVDKVAGKGLSTNDYTDADKEKLAGLENYDDTQVRQLITQTNANFANYYTKSESYSATEVDTLLRTQRQGQFVVVNTLPSPSADTMFKIYLAPSVEPETQNVKDEFVTLENNGTYSWEKIGTTAIDLSGYSTTEEMNAAIANALASYYTKSEVDNAVKNMVAESGVYDVSANNDNIKFESLSALLGSANLNTLIPTDIRKGGMSIKFVRSSDNKYVQYIYTSSSITVADFTNIDNWQQTNIEELNYVIGSPKSVILDITSGDVYRDIMYRVKKGWPIKGTVYNSGSVATDVYIAFYDSSNNRIDNNIILYSLAPNTTQEFSAVPSDAIDTAYIRFTVTVRTILDIVVSAVKTDYLKEYINKNIDYHESTLQPVSGNYILAFDNLSIKSGDLFRLDITGSSEWNRLVISTDGDGINRIYDSSIPTNKVSLKLTASNNITKLFYHLAFSGQNSVNTHLYTGNALTIAEGIDTLKLQSAELSNEIGQHEKQIQVTLPSGQLFTTGLIFSELNLHQGDVFYIKFSGDISATRLILRVNAVDGDNIIDYASADTWYKYVCAGDVQNIYYWINGNCDIVFDLKSGLSSEIIDTYAKSVEHTDNSVGAFTSHISDTLSAGNKVVRLFNGLNIKTNDKFYIKINGDSSARLILRANEGYNNTIQDYAKVNHLYCFTAQLDITSIWLWYNGDVNLDIELSIGEDKRLKDLIQTPLSYFPDYIVNNLGEKMLGCTTKGYLCITDDDGTSPAITYTLPMVQNKNIPFTFCICSSSEIMRDASARSTFINAVLAQNSKIHIAQHALYNWTENSESELYNFFKNERDYFDSLGVEVNGAAIPSHYTSNLIQAVAGGLYKVVRASYTTYNGQGVADNPPRSLYEWRPPVSSPRGNIYCLTSANILDYTLAQWKENIDYAVTNKRLVNIYMHDFNFVERYPEDISKPAIHTATAEEVAARKALLEGVIDYAKSVNIEIVSLGDVARLT